MASLTYKRGLATVQVVGADGKRRSIRLGRVRRSVADEVRVRVRRLELARKTGQSLDGDTAAWVAGIDDRLLDKLVLGGLVGRRRSGRETLGAFLDGYVSDRGDVKRSTAIVYGHTRRCLAVFFGREKLMRDITAGDADRWRIWLAGQARKKGVGKGLADNTVRRRCGIAKQFFRAAVRDKLIGENPFAHLVAAVRRNDKRHCFVDQADAEKVLEACPDAQWRLVFALSRYGGLRCPSEHLALRWADVDWANGWMTVRSPKTEHHPGGESRRVPIFPELRAYLVQAFELADGAEFVISIRRDVRTNLRTRMVKIIERAGLKPWPKLFQNLRATRETELARAFPLHLVVAWLGNSQAVAMKHYLQVTDEDHRRAAGVPEAVQKAVQQPRENRCNGVQADAAAAINVENCEGLHLDANPCFRGMGGTGLEPVTSTV